jgi:hypothetical protein
MIASTLVRIESVLSSPEGRVAGIGLTNLLLLGILLAAVLVGAGGSLLSRPRESRAVGQARRA